MEQYKLITTLEDGTVLQSSRFSNKAMKAINAALKKNGIKFTKLQDDEAFDLFEHFEDGIAVMFEKPYTEYCKEHNKSAEEYAIDQFMDDILPKELGEMKSKVLSWYTESFSAIEATEKNTDAPEGQATQTGKTKKMTP